MTFTEFAINDYYRNQLYLKVKEEFYIRCLKCGIISSKDVIKRTELFLVLERISTVLICSMSIYSEVENEKEFALDKNNIQLVVNQKVDSMMKIVTKDLVGSVSDYNLHKYIS